MNIHEIEKVRKSATYGLVLIVLALIGLLLGGLLVIKKSMNSKVGVVIRTQELPVAADPVYSAPSMQSPGAYVASKNGRAYYLPWCGAAKRISETNKIWFETKESAEQAGYKPAKNCPGI